MMSVPIARSGNRGSEAVDERQVALARVGAAHRLQNPRRARLERQVHVLADGVALGHGRDDRVAEVLRVRAREADALDPLDRVDGAQELAEIRADVGRQVAAPGVDVLAEERDLAHAVRGEARHLGDDLARAPALLAAAHGRDDAVRAGRVAAHRDLHPGLERRRGAAAARRRTRGRRAEAAARDAHAAGAEPVAEMGDRAGPERDVDLRVELEDPLALRLGVAAADGDHAIRDPRASAPSHRRDRRRASCRASRGSCRC